MFREQSEGRCGRKGRMERKGGASMADAGDGSFAEHEQRRRLQFEPQEIDNGTCASSWTWPDVCDETQHGCPSSACHSWSWFSKTWCMDKNLQNWFYCTPPPGSCHWLCDTCADFDADYNHYDQCKTCKAGYTLVKEDSWWGESEVGECQFQTADLTCPVVSGSREISWNDLRDAASYAYDEDGAAADDPELNGWTRIMMVDTKIDRWLVDSIASASFLEKNGVVVLAFRGTESLGDWVNNAAMKDKRITDFHGNEMDVHGGFYRYMEAVEQRVNAYKGWLESECGVAVDLITGHSLGGAAATLYATKYGEPKGFGGDGSFGVVTFGAPATTNSEWFRRRLYDMDNHDCDTDLGSGDCIGCGDQKQYSVRGMRFYNEKDPVPTGYSGYEHIISHYETSECVGSSCDAGWTGIACHSIDTGYAWVSDVKMNVDNHIGPTRTLAPAPASDPDYKDVGKAKKKKREAAPSVIIAVCVVAAVLLVAALFFWNKRAVASKQPHRESSMITIGKDDVEVPAA